VTRYGAHEDNQQEEKIMSRGTVGVAPSTTTITLPDGSTIALGDWIDDRLYGTVQFQNGDGGAVEAFASGRSQQIPGGTRNQTFVDTNVPRNGDNGLPKDWEMLVYGLAIKPVRAMRPPTGSAGAILADTGGAFSNPMRLQNLFMFDRVTFFQFNYNDKMYSQGTPTDYPAGTGYSVFATTTSFEIAQNGITSPRDRTALVLPIHMKENLMFKGVFSPAVPLILSQPASDGGVALTFIDVKVTMNGLIKRTVV
jgi:hypothetical protein